MTSGTFTLNIILLIFLISANAWVTNNKIDKIQKSVDSILIMLSEPYLKIHEQRN